MSMMYRSAIRVLVLSVATGGVAFAQPATTEPQPQPPLPTALPPATVQAQATADTPVASAQVSADASTTTKQEEPKKKEPGRGDFDAGGQVRLPNGPDENDEYATFNWIAVDLKGRYFLLDSITVNGNIPLAVKHPDTAGMMGPEPKMIGGMTGTLEIKLPENMPFVPKQNKSELGLSLTGAYMREGAMMLSEKDYPLFQGDFQPGFKGGLLVKIKLSSLVDFSLTPAWLYQSGAMESQQTVHVPMSLVIKLGEMAKLSTDLGVYGGDDYSFRGKNGGRLSAGGALTLKIGPILAHAGAGVASLLTGGLYPTIRDSVYIDLNVKYAK